MPDMTYEKPETQEETLRAMLRKVVESSITFNRFLQKRYYTCRICDSAWDEHEKHFDFCVIPKVRELVPTVQLFDDATRGK